MIVIGGASAHWLLMFNASLPAIQVLEIMSFEGVILL